MSPSAWLVICNVVLPYYSAIVLELRAAFLHKWTDTLDSPRQISVFLQRSLYDPGGLMTPTSLAFG